jgi:L-lysine exporter family protein LysE/ArgO
VKSAFKASALVASNIESNSRAKIILTALALTYLNPHVYLDTVIFVGGLANQFESYKWFFALGASAASFIWFFSIGYGAKAASRLMSKPIFWKILDLVIATIMFTIAITLAFFEF